jgi:hypothetical protein
MNDYASYVKRLSAFLAPMPTPAGPSAPRSLQGIPTVLHLDNAAEFKSKALRAGCSQYGIEFMYRPVGRPHFGGHIERFNRTLMQRLQGLPGATENSVKVRRTGKIQKPEEGASMTLREFERWLAITTRRTCLTSSSRSMESNTSKHDVQICGARRSLSGSNARHVESCVIWPLELQATVAAPIVRSR